MSLRLGRPIMVAAFSLVALTVAAEPVEVDLELILSADASGSMSGELGDLQRRGFAAAFRNPALQDALLSGLLGRVAVSYFEWSGATRQQVTVPWRLLDSRAAIDSFAARLETAEAAPPGGGTSISAALLFAVAQLAASPFVSQRQVVDISGNGPNNAGPPMETALAAVAKGHIVVNAIAFPESEPGSDNPFLVMFVPEDPDLLEYFDRTVRQGPGSFAIAVESHDDIARAILRKLVLEVAVNGPEVLGWSPGILR